MVSSKHILRNSEELNRLSERIHVASRGRRASDPASLDKHLEACREFHERFDSLMYPGGCAVFNRVRQHDPHALETAVTFLLADPIHFRSGYLKEYLWRWLVHCPLSDLARSRLERAALGYLDRPIKREFAAMCRAMHRIGREAFWMRVSHALLSVDVLKVRRAELLLIHKGSLFAGAVAHRRRSGACALHRQPGHRPGPRRARACAAGRRRHLGGRPHRHLHQRHRAAVKNKPKLP